MSHIRPVCVTERLLVRVRKGVFRCDTIDGKTDWQISVLGFWTHSAPAAASALSFSHRGSCVGYAGV